MIGVSESSRKIAKSLMLASLLMVSTSCQSAPIPVVIEETTDGFRLLRGGKPYVVKGAGGVDDLEVLAQYGGNSIRTWHVEEDIGRGLDFLDRAHALGLTVSLCLNISRERHGFDYNNRDMVKAQFDAAQAAVRAYRNHPALLTWIIGNELNMSFKNPAVYDAVNDIAVMIHEEDPHHPATTTIAGWDHKLVSLIESRAPALDFLSVQLYGDLINLPRYLKEVGYRKPYFVTEWGAIGHWEVGKTAWGAPIEQTSSEKAQNYWRSYEEVIASDPHYAIGNYVFLWGQKQERTPTWYGLFTESGEKTEAVDVMTRIWTQQAPKNQSPQISSLQMDQRFAADNIILRPGQKVDAIADVVDADDDKLRFAWSIKQESDTHAEGGDHEETPVDIPGLIPRSSNNSITLKAPLATGAYRLFVYAYDGQGAAAHANIPFLVQHNSSGAKE